jgi:hypothetical protein
VFILAELDKVLQDLDEDLAAINTMLGNKFVKRVVKRVELWSKRLLELSDTIDVWWNCQRSWL